MCTCAHICWVNELSELCRCLKLWVDSCHAYLHIGFYCSFNMLSLQITVDRSPIRLQRSTAQGYSRSGNHLRKNSIAKQDGFSNGSMQVFPLDATPEKVANSLGSEKVLVLSVFVFSMS